ncbi:MAG: DUF935 domain-containing protein [Kangiella sp.]|nr:DUF935 domain-containing protein [Kangiella sp.]
MDKIVDQYGNPIKSKQLEQRQSEAALSMLGGLPSTFGEDPSQGLTIPKLVNIFREAKTGRIEQMANLFEMMEEKDGHIFSEMSKRKRVIQTLDWDIKPPRNATKDEIAHAEWVKEVIQDLDDFDDLIIDLADAIGKGFSAIELCWERIGNEMLPCRFEYHHQRLFTINPDKPNEILLRDGKSGQELWPFGWITHIHKAKSGYLGDAALFRVLAWPYLFKNYSVRDLAQFLEIYGLPLRLGKYPGTATDEEKRTLLRAVLSIGNNAGGIIPQGMEIDFEAAAEGSEGPFMSMIEWCERIQSKAILGATLTSQADGKSSTNALGNVHNEVRHELTVSDGKQLAKTLTAQLVFPLLAINKSGITDFRRCPRFIFDTEDADDVKAYSESIPKFVDMGMRIPADWLHEKLKIPKAEDGEEYVLKQETKQLNEGTKLTALSRQDDIDDADRVVEQLETTTDEAMTGLIDPVRKLVEKVESLQELRDGILELYQELDHTQLGEQLERAMLAAHLLGRFEVSDGD